MAVLALALAACSSGGGGGSGATSGGGPQATAAQPKPGGSVVVGIESESAGWLPGKDTQTAAGFMVMYAIHDPLMSYGADLKPRPFLAESLTPNADLTQYTVKLRAGIKFHDGTPLNAQALKDAFDNYLKPATARTAGALRPVLSLDVVDELTAIYKLDGPNAAFPDLLATPPINFVFSPTAAKAAGDNYSAHPVGTGPFIFDSWQRDSQLVVKKNPNYWRKGLPLLEQVTFRPLPDEDSRLASLQSGDVDVMHTVRQAQNVVKASKSGNEITSYPKVGNPSALVVYAMSHPPLDDKRVRQGLAYALDQKALISVQGLEGLAPESSQLFAKDSPYYSPTAEQKYPKQDVTKAKSLIQSYVNDPKRSDGKAVGAPITFKLTCTAGVASLNDLSVLYQSSWRNVGVQVDLDLIDQASLINKLVGPAPDFKAAFDVSCSRAGLDGDPDLLYNGYHDLANAANVTDYSNPRVTQLFEDGRKAADPEARRKIYQEINDILVEDVPLTYHGALVTAVGAKSGVKGIDDWTFADGSKGWGARGSVVRFGEVWRADQ